MGKKPSKERHHHAAQKKHFVRPPRQPEAEISASVLRPESQILAAIAPLDRADIDRLDGEKVIFRGEILPSNYIVSVDEHDHLIEGQIIGFVRPINNALVTINPNTKHADVKAADAGQLLYWEKGQIVARSARQRPKFSGNGQDHR